MSTIKPIRTEADYEAALARIEVLMDARPRTPEADELEVLADLVEHWEEKHVPMGFPSPVAAIEFRMEQAGLAPRDLIPFIGSRAKVSEVLSEKRPPWSLARPGAEARPGSVHRPWRSSSSRARCTSIRRSWRGG